MMNRIIKIILALTALVICFLLFLIVKRRITSGDLIVIEARYMQYACGDWNDDMQVYTVSSKEYSFLVEKDIDPQAGLLSLSDDLQHYFYENKENEFGMRYRLKGRLEKSSGGCDRTAPRFWVEEIERMDGSNR